MNFEDLQKTWQSHNAGATVTISAEALLKEVRRNQRQFWRTIFWRDVREVVIAIFLIIFFLYYGLRHHLWTFGLMALACFVVASFLVVDRVLQRRKRPMTNDSLKACIESSLHQVSHQIWLLKNVLWWYLLPIFIPLVITFLMAFRNPLMVRLFNILFTILLYWVLYWLNQYAVRKSLEPRRQELKNLLASLEKTYEN